MESGARGGKETKLQVHDLRISFRTVSGKLQAVRGISFDLRKGETLAIVGESGSGKSVTSKAILGIQAGNSIVEGGEILFDGQDLLKIGEEDFYKIRGDKIAMIFQDPLSSLNPIMRIGKQLTEAMLLKGKARQRASKASFRQKLRLLEKYMNQADPKRAEAAKRDCALFRRFVMKGIRLEQAYNAALEAAREALAEIAHIQFLIEKNAFAGVSAERRSGRVGMSFVLEHVSALARAQLREVRELSLRSINPYVVSDRAEELKQVVHELIGGLTAEARRKEYSETAQRLSRLAEILDEAVKKTKPDFFAMGYALEKGIEPPAAADSVERANAFYAKELDAGFMADFAKRAEGGLAFIDARHDALRAKVIKELDATLKTIDSVSIGDFRPRAAELGKLVGESIDPIDLIKDSAAYTFAGSLKGFVDAYFEGVKTNGKKIKKYERQLAKHERLTRRGKTPGWTVAAPSVVDFDLVKQNIVALMANLKGHYEERAAASLAEDKRRKTERLMEYLKENASGMVLKVTKRAARDKALRLMEEVGIPEPRKRYRQYPFEFSGGMRQRIVIAIALAANPDILICDEPTTALDVTIQSQILELINKLKRERNLSIIFITHDLGVVANMADHIAVMYAGKIVEYGTSEEVFYSPAHPYTWALLGSMPDLETKEKLEAIPGTPPNMIYPPKGDAFAERNRYAMQIDFEQQPPEFPITDTHWAATWLLHPNAPKVDPPKALTDRIQRMKARMEVMSNG